MPQAHTWKDALQGQLSADLEEEINIYETQIALRHQGKIDERVFAESRLRRGIYGQRYDNGQRHDGKKIQKLELPSAGLTKGPDTVWDAPGMMRIKIAFGGLDREEVDVGAGVCEEYS